mgnify:CR=1 FL=1
MTDRFDIVVAGAGHNSLVAAAYLAKAGYKCLVLEGRSVLGGNVITEELTLPGFRHAPIWFSLFGPAALPRPIVDRLHGAVVKALNVPEVREQFEKTSMRVIGSTPEAFSIKFRSDIAGYAKAVQDAKLPPVRLP